MKREIRHFHVVFVQRQQRNVEKSVMHVQSCCFAYPNPGFANFIGEWSQCDFCFANFGVTLEYLESSITTKKAIFRLSSTWSWHAYTIVRDSSCGGPLTWKVQIHDGGHRVNFDRNLPSGVVAPCLLPKISPSVTWAESSEQFWRKIRQNLAYLRTLLKPTASLTSSFPLPLPLPSLMLSCLMSAFFQRSTFMSVHNLTQIKAKGMAY